MRRLRKVRITPGTVLASIALFLALGGVSYAAATVVIPPHSITSKQIKAHSLLALDFKAGQIPRGAVGPAGAPGPAGPAGSAAASKWVLVNPNGSIAAQSGGITITTHTTGTYIIDFGSAVDSKLILASPGVANDGGARGDVVAGPCGGTATGQTCTTGNDTSHVIVTTYNVANTALTDHSFYVAVFG
ncbi:MAG TPA: hypothetical protein VGN06_09250 [Gaiellaceae bacterium]